MDLESRILWDTIGRKIRINSPRIRAGLNVVSNAEGLMHELIHGLQGRGADDQLGTALRDLGIVPIRRDGTPLPFPKGEKPYDWSDYWDQALRNACFPTMQ